MLKIILLNFIVFLILLFILGGVKTSIVSYRGLIEIASNGKYIFDVIKEEPKK